MYVLLSHCKWFSHTSSIHRIDHPSQTGSRSGESIVESPSGAKTGTISPHNAANWRISYNYVQIYLLQVIQPGMLKLLLSPEPQTKQGPVPLIDLARLGVSTALSDSACGCTITCLCRKASVYDINQENRTASYVSIGF